MINEALRRIAKVQKVDAAILELRRRLAAMDPGAAAQAKRDEAKAAFEEADKRLKALRSELQDLELESKKIEQKIKSETARLYSGGVYNAKDAEAIDREVKNLKARLGGVDERILQLWEEVPPAQEKADRLFEDLKVAEAELEGYLKKYAAVKAEIEAKLAQLLDLRTKAVVGCDPELLAKYDVVREHRHGIGLAPVQDGECGVCHNSIPKLQKERIEEGESLETCEGCGRYLYTE